MFLFLAALNNPHFPARGYFFVYSQNNSCLNPEKFRLLKASAVVLNSSKLIFSERRGKARRQINERWSWVTEATSALSRLPTVQSTKKAESQLQMVIKQLQCLIFSKTYTSFFLKSWINSVTAIESHHRCLAEVAKSAFSWTRGDYLESVKLW